MLEDAVNLNIADNTYECLQPLLSITVLSIYFLKK